MMRVELGAKSILITKTVVNTFWEYRQLKHSENERGGIILGQVNQCEDKVLVNRASVPTKLDASTKHSFLRSKEAAQQIVNHEFQKSEGRTTYLGEWHTHPSKHAFPSPRDIDMIKEQFVTNDIRTGFLLMFVVAREEIFLGLYDGQQVLSVTLNDIVVTNLESKLTI